ncbi:hypothetical protein MRB53_020321 [Persea americana]|uniref:Uncharacterized protein n=1 Tax=Persea americana TaxID=3435 RepID=A0ACC2L1U9_PERAE|nr:hypothetical protein MRB53_020321 [Persea americana]
MDSPERNQIGTPISKFEDSPVFNYINNLSPIKPVKSLHIAQTFHSLNFASIPSVFTSPHISSQKESRFLGRHHFSDFSKLEISSNDGDGGKMSTSFSGSVKLSDCSSASEQEKCDIGVSMEEFNVERSNGCSKLSVKLPQALQYVGSLGYGNPDNDTSCCAIKMETDEGASVDKLPQENPKEGTCSVETQGQYQLEQTKEEGSCYDWENLISDAAPDVLIFNSSTESVTCREEDSNMVDFDATSFALVSHPPQDEVGGLHNAQPVSSLHHDHQQQNPINQLEEVEDGEQKETDHTPQLLPSVYQNKQDTGDLSEKMDDKVGDCISLGKKVDTPQQRGMRRRCLVFDVGAQKKNAVDDSKSDSLNSMQSEGKCASDDKKLVPLRPGIGSSSQCVLPSIGLHLNALASTSKDFRIVKHESLTSVSRLISMPRSVGSFHSLTAAHNSANQSLAPNNAQGDLSSNGNAVQVMQDDLQEPALEIAEEFNQNSPKKKRRRLENAGEGEACKRCNCKKSKCLKLYCECFAAGVYCVEPCSCHDCFNKPVHEDTVLATRKQIESRNPLAFAPKVIRNSETILETGDEGINTPASARHKRGCNCKKSSCLKKYCECYQGGVGCSSNCRCEGCKNAYGRKGAGYAPAGTEEAEPEDEVSEVGEKDGIGKCQEIMEVHKDQQLIDAVLPMTPFQICRKSVKVSFFSNGKPPRPSLVTGGSSSSCVNTCQPLKKSDFLQHQLTFEKHFQINPEDETPEILRGHCSPGSGVKTTSPNGKRVSPPNRELGLSPGQRSTSTRKLILQSIPSFPSLTPYHQSNGI